MSIPSNIAEGQGRGNKKEFYYFLRIANGPLREVEMQLTLAERLQYAKPEEIHPVLSQTGEVAKIIFGLMKRQL